MRIEARELCKSFTRLVNDKDKKSRKEEFFAVDHVDIDAHEGEILGVLGPNGAGKTTLLRMLGNLLEPGSGYVHIIDEQGERITDPIKIKSCIGYLSGNTRLYGRLSARELMHTIGEIYGMDDASREARIDQIVDVLKMQEFVDNRIERLSTGQTQRANIARCLVHSPGIYIFDEPTLGLDILSSEAIVEFMKSEKTKGRTVLYSTHYMEEAQYLCDRVIMMYKGRIIANDSPSGLMEMTGTDNLRDTFRAIINEGETEEKEDA
ncbi:MAG: ABC transporter ATP-binding protein [Lachnospiraceae bacterium]|nr:ABC transporter ATP-binding protein [Lachnospiraceae bacterium]